ncbi:hypothetical protein SXCC_03439 [Gluconacetobacter sp. SXCC-1]|nr:hypothetical protein SXCC_03439 [Gluconacetobacter sp. SXCC-1]
MLERHGGHPEGCPFFVRTGRPVLCPLSELPNIPPYWGAVS